MGRPKTFFEAHQAHVPMDARDHQEARREMIRQAKDFAICLAGALGLGMVIFVGAMF